MKETKLLNCPFCGGEAELLKGLCELDNYVMCLECRCKTKLYNTKESAIKKWNTRKPMERILKRLKEEKNALYNARSKYRKAMFNNDDAFNKCKVLHEKEMSINEAIKIAKEEGGIE